MGISAAIRIAAAWPHNAANSWLNNHDNRSLMGTLFVLFVLFVLEWVFRISWWMGLEARGNGKLATDSQY